MTGKVAWNDEENNGNDKKRGYFMMMEVENKAL